MGLKESFGYACPECGQDEIIHIECYPAWTSVCAIDDDDYDFDDNNAGHDWGLESRSECPACYWHGVVDDLETACKASRSRRPRRS